MIRPEISSLMDRTAFAVFKSGAVASVHTIHSVKHLCLSRMSGSIAYLPAYLLLSFNKLKPDHKAYHYLNVAGAVGLTLNAIFLQDHPNAIVSIA